MDRLRAYQVFVAVVARNGFGRAAAELGISPANVSRHVQQLEASLGARLLERSSRRLALTDAGRNVYERARRVLDDIAELETSFADPDSAARGRLRVNAPLTFGLVWLAPLLPEFAGRHPAIDLDIRYSDRVVEMTEEAFDVALRISPAGPESHVSRRVASTRMRLCAAPSLLARIGNVGDVDTLLSLPRIGYQFSDTGNVWSLLAPDGFRREIDTPCAVTCASGLGMKAAMQRGEGVALLPDFLIHRELASGEIVSLLPAYRNEAMDIRIVYAGRRHLARPVRLFIDFVAESFRRPPWDAPGR
ncbi:LysR family transcriptional regulator [Ancylobacter oerskovii]|uniref:LysR family transcriptional regulator n=1 Tax=Ancylobacter oerskovii TaxID=459519 RepID=A0ABW4Z2X3_9HYPH|nr:LysR family transcriptional regulator [Ancylobacter oerskovii]MBS7546194.1 LysR family transcriptional regulator [Ancylobacter oerskovii]